MNTPSEGMLAQRQLRAAEIALETARQRRREADAELAEAEAEVEEIRAALAESEAARREAEEQLHLARVARTAAEQRYVEERHRRLTLEQELGALRREENLRTDIAGQLAAEARIRELEGSLEVVTQHAAAFEYGVRMAAFDAFKLVREMTDVVTGLLARTGLVDAQDHTSAVEASAAAEPVNPVAPAVQPQPESPPQAPQEASPLRALNTFRRIPVPRRAAELNEDPGTQPDPVTGRPAETLRTAPPRPLPDGPGDRPAEAPYSPPARPRDRDAVRPPSVASVLDSQRLDAALERLRATTPPPADEQ